MHIQFNHLGHSEVRISECSEFRHGNTIGIPCALSRLVRCCVSKYRLYQLGHDLMTLCPGW